MQLLGTFCLYFHSVSFSSHYANEKSWMCHWALCSLLKKVSQSVKMSAHAYLLDNAQVFKLASLRAHKMWILMWILQTPQLYFSATSRPQQSPTSQTTLAQWLVVVQQVLKRSKRKIIPWLGSVGSRKEWTTVNNTGRPFCVEYYFHVTI